MFTRIFLFSILSSIAFTASALADSSTPQFDRDYNAITERVQNSIGAGNASNSNGASSFKMQKTKNAPLSKQQERLLKEWNTPPSAAEQKVINNQQQQLQQLEKEVE